MKLATRARRALHIRADATESIGAGHVMRCCSLAEAWRRAGFGEALLVGRVSIPFVRDRLTAAEVPVLSEWPADSSTAIVVVDSYDLSVRREALDRQADIHVVADDIGDGLAAEGEVIWNPNLYSSRDLYGSHTPLLLSGPRFVPVRSGLPIWAEFEPRQIAVSLGGGQVPSNLVAAITSLSVIQRLEFRGVGSWVPSEWKRVDADSPWQDLATCQCALVGAGTTLAEAAAVGMPIMVIQVTPNQRLGAEFAEREGVPLLRVDPDDAPQALASRLWSGIISARKLPRLPPNGSDRTARALNDLASSTTSRSLRLRRARELDAAILLEWANDEATRANAGNRAVIDVVSHSQWLRTHVADPYSIVLIGEVAGAQVGSIRFDSLDEWATARLSYVVAPPHRGRGLGFALVWHGLRWLEVETQMKSTTVYAEVMDSNERSARVFNGLGWVESRAGRPGYLRFTTVL